MTRKWHRPWDAGLWGIHPQTLTIHLSSVCRQQFFHSLKGHVIHNATRVRADASRYAFPPESLLFWRWQYFLQQAAVRETDNKPYFCVLCNRAWKREKEYALHPNFDSYKKAHEADGSTIPLKDWYGIGCTKEVVVPDLATVQEGELPTE